MLGTKEDFELIRQQINIEAVANHLMKKQGKNYIFPSEKSASVRIYPETQSFYDFGRCTGGDVIRLWSHVRDVDSWTALCQIREIFGLNTPDRKNSRDLIRQQEQARQKQQQAEKAEKRRWRLQVEALQPTMFVGCGTRADQGDFECKIKNRVPVSLPCVPDRDGNSANRKVIVLSFIASLL